MPHLAARQGKLPHLFLLHHHREMTAPETGHGPGPRRLGAGPHPLAHTQIFGSVVGLGSSETPAPAEQGRHWGGRGKRSCEAGTPTYTSKVSIAKALRTNPENSVKG